MKYLILKICWTYQILTVKLKVTVYSYIILLEYVINSKNVKMNIELPEELENITYLNLTNNSIRQINVISNSNNYKGQWFKINYCINKCKIQWVNVY